MLALKSIVTGFFEFAQHNNTEIYNEFSLQHEMGIYLRSVLPNHKVQFERNVSFFAGHTNTTKKEIDISIFDGEMQEKYALELKCPLNGQHPEQMYSFAKDIRFMEELLERGFTGAGCVVLVSDRPFYEGKVNTGIYQYFRSEFAVYGDIYKPTGPNKYDEFVSLAGRHEFRWQNFGSHSKCYVIDVKDGLRFHSHS